MGVVVERRAISGVRQMMDASVTVVRAEAAATHGVLLRRGVRLDPLVRRRLEEGLQVRSTVYAEARATCARLRGQILRELFGVVDAVLAPVIPRRPPLLAEAAGLIDDVVVAMADFAKFGRFFNALGIPVLTWPCGYADGMPWSLQLATRPYEEGTLFAIGMRYEERQPCFRPPPVSAGDTVADTIPT
jgi:Asp-tRNA(Asn)/Glu-tRNA(Gln) amidotransferase A subunit family amidase